MKRKSEKLEDTVYDVLFSPETAHAAITYVGRDEVVIWTYNINEVSKYICCNYLIWFKDTKSWIAKPISEMEGPAALDCPIIFFTFEVDDDMIFPEWRYEVKKFHENIGSPVQEHEIAIRLADALKRKHK